MADPVTLEALQPTEALKFFRGKGLAIGFDWRDIWQQEHAVAFTVAKATRIELLETIRTSVDRAIADGITFSQFKQELTPLLQREGWWGQKPLTDPLTGETRRVQLGSPRRLRIIFDTNLRMASAAGRWEKIERLADRRPFLRYLAVLDERTREDHRRWHGTVLPVDHKFWKTHYPPNGWRCRCVVQQLSEAQMKQFGYTLSDGPPPGGTKLFENKRTGERSRVPVGIDPGFAYNVGQARLHAFTPPPKGGLPSSFPAGVELPPLPKPSKPPRGRILEEGLRDRDYAEAFLNQFGASIDKPVIFTDRVGEDLVISERLFQSAAGRWKSAKLGRGRFMALLALAIKEPDEIWWVWDKGPTGRNRLSRRYIKRWDMPEGERGIAVFEYHHKDGWTGVTTFPAGQRRAEQRERYINRQRGGLLAYRRSQ